MIIRRIPLLLVAVILAVVSIPGCSDDDDNTVNPNGNTRLYIQPVINSQFTFDVSTLDSANTPIPSSTYKYTVDFKSTNGALVYGPYTDWYKRLGTALNTGKKDTVYFRLNTGTSGSTTFTKEVMTYGFCNYFLTKLAETIATQFGIPMPQIPGKVGDVIAKFYDDAGTELANGTTWTVGDVNGVDLSFLIQAIPVTINVKFKGTMESKTETFTVKSKTIKTWKESITATINILGTNNVMKMYFWYSDDPDGQIRFKQESATFTVPFIGITVPIGGELDDLSDFQI